MPRRDEDSAHGGKAPHAAGGPAKEDASAHGSVSSYKAAGSFKGTDLERDTSQEFQVGGPGRGGWVRRRVHAGAQHRSFCRRANGVGRMPRQGEQR